MVIAKRLERQQPQRCAKRKTIADDNVPKRRPVKKKRADVTGAGASGLANGFLRANSPAASAELDDPHAVSHATHKDVLLFDKS